MSHQLKFRYFEKTKRADSKQFGSDDLDLPGMQFHPLSGRLKGYFSVSVNGNWRVIYGFKDENAVLVDYLDYH
ncbi:MAG: type II toxin-antitoxin system RelE/ParE family toxin [Gammaproteobacteria bacterium]|nr:type II toxin-antitoxin system RelE/ParE family toxin [Gammaproteobacteria bacterium]